MQRTNSEYGLQYLALISTQIININTHYSTQI